MTLDTNNLTNALTNSIVYGDMTALAMMGPMFTGMMGMTGVKFWWFNDRRASIAEHCNGPTHSSAFARCSLVVW